MRQDLFEGTHLDKEKHQHDKDGVSDPRTSTRTGSQIHVLLIVPLYTQIPIKDC